MTVKAVAADVHDEAKRVHVLADAHEGQEADTTLHQHFALILLTKTLQREKNGKTYFICQDLVGSAIIMSVIKVLNILVFHEKTMVMPD